MWRTLENYLERVRGTRKLLSQDVVHWTDFGGKIMYCAVNRNVFVHTYRAIVSL